MSSVKVFRLAFLIVITIGIATGLFIFYKHPISLFEGIGCFIAIVGLSLTLYQIYLSIRSSEHQDLNFEISQNRLELDKAINESNDLCRERFDQQQQIINYLLERVNLLTIDIKSHERLPGHNNTSAQIMKLQEDVAEVKAGLSIISKQGELIHKISRLENAIKNV